MPEPNVSDPSYKVWSLCFHVRGQLEGKKNFMDNINVVNAIKSNDPDKVTSLANEFISTFRNSISVLFVGGRKGIITPNIMRSDDGQNASFHLDLDRFRGISINCLIMIQFALWSCVSEKCFRCITALLLNSRVDIKVDEEISWSWMENLVKCVRLTSKFVYHTYASDHQKQYPCCEVLLLAKTLFQTSSTFVRLASDPTAMSALSIFFEKQKFKNRIEIGALTAMTSSFKSYCQQNAYEINGVKNEHTLEFFMEYENHIITTHRFLCRIQVFREKGKLRTNSIIHDVALVNKGEGGNTTTPEQVLQFKVCKNLTKEEELEKETKEKEMQQIGKASSTCGAHNIEDEVPTTKDPLLEKSKEEIEKKIKEKEIGKASSTSGAHNIDDEVPTTKYPLLEETKFKKLHSWLLRLKKVLDENNGILKQLQKDRVSKEDYLARCFTFSKVLCPKDLGEAYFDHFYRSLAFFGLMIHEVLKCGIQYKKMTKIHIAIFAPILFYSLDGVSPKMMATYQFWHAFLTKLVPKCITTNSSIRDASSKLRHFMGQCLNSIGDKGMEEVLFSSGNSPNECLAFYYEQNYLSNNTKRLVLEMKSDFEKKINRQSKRSMLVIDSAGVLKEKKVQSKKKEDANSELSKTTKDSSLKKRIRAAKDSNKELKDAKRRSMESIAIDEPSPSANLRKRIRVAKDSNMELKDAKGRTKKG